MTYIYALIDPRTSECRYTGKADDVPLRAQRHLRKSSLSAPTHKNCWLLSLVYAGLKPEVVVLDTIPKKDWQTYEQWWIAYLRFLGVNLTNGTTGGDGAVLKGAKNPMFGVKGPAHPAYGKPRPDDVRQRIKASLTGKPVSWSEEGRKSIIESNRRRAKEANPFKGQKHTAEAKAMMSAAKKGKKLTQEHKDKVAAASKRMWEKRKAAMQQVVLDMAREGTV